MEKRNLYCNCFLINNREKYFSKERKECMDGEPSYQNDSSNSRKYWPAQADVKGIPFLHCISGML